MKDENLKQAVRNMTAINEKYGEALFGAHKMRLSDRVHAAHGACNMHDADKAKGDSCLSGDSR